MSHRLLAGSLVFHRTRAFLDGRYKCPSFPSFPLQRLVSVIRYPLRRTIDLVHVDIRKSAACRVLLTQESIFLQVNSMPYTTEKIEIQSNYCEQLFKRVCLLQKVIRN